MEKTMMRMVLAVVTAHCGLANAATVCTNAQVSSPGVAVAEGGYVRATFTPKCSARVFAEVQDNTSYFAVGTVSSRGRSSFGGSTVGGGIQRIGECATQGACAVSDAQAAVPAASS